MKQIPLPSLASLGPSLAGSARERECVCLCKVRAQSLDYATPRGLLGLLFMLLWYMWYIRQYPP